MTKTVKLLEYVHLVIWIKNLQNRQTSGNFFKELFTVRRTGTYRKDICAYSETPKSESHELPKL